VETRTGGDPGRSDPQAGRSDAPINVAKEGGMVMINRHVSMAAVLVAAVVALSPVHADSPSVEKFHARLTGFEEIGALTAPTGAILSDGTATIDVELYKSAQTANYTLTINPGLSSKVLQSHIHFGKVHVAGGVMVFFCSNLGNGPALTPACPTPSGTVSGSWTAASVVLNAQNVTPGDFDALVKALETDTAYANVHTTNWPAGEIRGQVVRDRGDFRRPRTFGPVR
jgi:hypothetical protein